MSNQTPSLTIPSATTDELLHALSATIISQHATITLMSGFVMQLYSTVNQMPMEEVGPLFDGLFPSHVASANQGFVSSIHERQQQLRDLLHQ
ncbi:hypothetical protein [Hymenobacter fodinae]|uniref:Uncharacterized protein n=1 Tax=Hymenobacter fodinae TaxID=2510796 RepID=A0A4Z0NZE1_9BACT|nr:hypothetical protein [Hymenobacter fodinae]TGE03345.1 hypothetical protein EU556_25860 [Hymenobacter fodinae]